MALLNPLPICSKVQGVLLKESREGQRQVVALQYSDRSGEWYELEFPTHQVKRLIDLLIPFQMEIEQDEP
jgi:predicted DNA-binding transcriptional regulator YafY